MNQEDNEESGSQVKLMKDIYRVAQTVCVGLGPEADNSNLAISFLTPVLNIFRHNEELDELDYENL